MTMGQQVKPQVDTLLELLPDWIQQLIRINSLVASRMGVVMTDFHCLHVLQQGGPTTPGALAARVGLTAGSATRMVDRLEAAGCVTRAPDPKDRRKVVVVPTPEGLERASSYYADLTARTRDDLADFTDEELRVLVRFVQRSLASALEEADRLNAG
ncbi:MarR family winged helix-turn-helix transcriptional regulator [Nocardia pseudobrasiliensis]|uniref:DNA-binding MarR family transcriptional regulator n=1 Tax=Nocardia pseudobrasiliensis TaxID=45979 RepID=A0A370HW28_9NOCA|nr:MarR family transcriptional regulator [Nocardia pseudobrasiliensis]RDI62707.1 DNA-binding MarR family transcriptional regulator [Nocardia pseudobrasiliensis]